ncbi:MAG: VanW family protein [Firmicutes bacterium]|nr:VanW family protein [Bacillota bacterium]
MSLKHLDQGLVRFLVLLALYLALHVLSQPLIYSSPPILPSRLWASDGMVRFGQSSLAWTAAVPAGNGAAVQFYGLVPEENLPWFANPPLDLRDIKVRAGTERFINAFYTTVPQPILEEQQNTALAAAYLAGTVIEPNTVFSLNKSIGPRTSARGFGRGPLYKNGQLSATLGGGICKVATTMYNLAVYSDLDVVERHAHSMSVPYVPPGRDATLLWGSKDLRLVNNKDHPLLIWAEVKGNTLYIALYGQYDPPLVEWHLEEMNKVPTWTIRRKNSQLAPGEVRSVDGAEGMSVKSWVEIQYRGLAPSRKHLSTDFYRPLPNYIEYGP